MVGVGTGSVGRRGNLEVRHVSGRYTGHLCRDRVQRAVNVGRPEPEAGEDLLHGLRVVNEGTTNIHGGHADANLALD